MVPLERNLAPNLFFPCSHFMKKDAVAGIFPFYLFVHGSDMWQNLVYSTRAFRYLHLLLVHCFVIARHAHCCIPCPPNRDCPQSASLGPTMRSVPTAPSSPVFVSRRAELFARLKVFRPIHAIQGIGCRIGTVVSGTPAAGTGDGGRTAALGEMGVARVNP